MRKPENDESGHLVTGVCISWQHHLLVNGSFQPTANRHQVPKRRIAYQVTRAAQPLKVDGLPDGSGKPGEANPASGYEPWRRLQPGPNAGLVTNSRNQCPA